MIAVVEKGYRRLVVMHNGLHFDIDLPLFSSLSFFLLVCLSEKGDGLKMEERA